MHSISQRLTTLGNSLATSAPTGSPVEKNKDPKATAIELADRLFAASTQLDQEAQKLAQQFSTLVELSPQNPAMLDCLEGCCELIEIMEELDDFQPAGNSRKQKKQRLQDAVLGLGRLLNMNQAALQKEKSLEDLLLFAKALGTAAEKNLTKEHDPQSGKSPTALRQQEQKLQTVLERVESLDAQLSASECSEDDSETDVDPQTMSALATEKNLLRRALRTLENASAVNATPQRFGSTSHFQQDSIKGNINEVDKQIKLLQKTDAHAPAESASARTNLKDLLTQQRVALKAKQAALDNYLSPVSTSKLCAAKGRCVAAAYTVLENELTKQKDKDCAAGKQALKNLSTRITVLKDTADKKLVIDTQKLVGQKKMGFLQQLLHPTRAGRQEAALKARASLYVMGTIDPKKSGAATSFFTEEMFMQAVLETALVPLGYSASHIKALLRAQVSESLNSENWAQINSSFSVPVHAARGTQILLPVTTQTTPAGHGLTNAANFSIVSTDSPITTATTAELRGGDTANPTIRGINSHCATELTHCTSLATSSLHVAGEELFSATRHGVCSAYNLTANHIQALPPAEREEVLASLSSQTSHAPTQLIIGRAATANDAMTLPDSRDTPLQTAINTELEKLGVPEGEMDAVLNNSVALADLALRSPVLCQLVKRVANLNRAREAFITELQHNKKLQARIAEGKPIHFNSISLLTPDQLRATQNAITGQGNAGNEKQMQIDQFQAWADLQSEIAGGGLTVNGNYVNASIRCLNFGVNKGAVHLSSNPVMGELVSGWDYIDAQNAAGMQALLGEVPEFLTDLSADLHSKQQRLALLLDATPPDQSRIQALDAKIKTLAADIHVLEQLHDQIAQMWEDKSYRQAGTEPYKMVTRLALLSYLLEGGTLFNCKSGKDRTAELDIEVKFLAFQIHASGGTVPVPDRERTDLEKTQLAIFMFEDESRRTMQEYNTGYGGSKLVSAPQVYDAITPGGSDKAATIAEFIGSSRNAGS